ncbi:MAG: efflux RND transporter periplasmic adaptor subunit [Candidatus Thiodiazotropha sp.]
MIRQLQSIFLVSLLILASGCELQHGHSHDGTDGHTHETTMADHTGHAEDSHDDQGDHADHGEDHADGHGHDPEAIAVTHFTDQTELFVEYPVLVVGGESAFAAHLTRLDDFQPVAEGRFTVRLSGGGLAEETFSVNAPSTPGIFRPIAKPVNAGERRLELILDAPDLSVTHDLGLIRVFVDSEAAAEAQAHEENGGDEISFLKEQQWKVDFATAEVGLRRIRASISATGTIKARSNGEAIVSAPTAGHLLPGKAFPRIGMQVTQGDTLVTIVPRVAGDVDIASLELAVQRAQSSLQLAVRERRRLADLVAQQAAPRKRLNEAESEERVARAELDAANRRLKQYQRTLDAGETGKATGVTVRAPISGTLAEIRVPAGSYVDEGQAMFHIVETDRLWLETRVAESDIGRLDEPSGAWFEVEGFDQVFEIDPDSSGKLVAFGNVVDPVSRTAPLVFEFDNSVHKLRVGMFTRVHIWSGERIEDVAIPVQALVEEAGQDVAYVMLGGESFERRVVKLGIREGGYVQVKSGLEPGERIVTRGAYLVRLAAASPAEAGHGHAH